jgi:hypothetical protein
VPDGRPPVRREHRRRHHRCGPLRVPSSRPSALRPEIPAEIDAITLRALARDPRRRFRTAHDMSEELDRYLLGHDSRPTSKSVGRWMETIFGSERATLKKAISQGGEIEATLDRLFALNADPPRQRASGRASGPDPRAASARRSRARCGRRASAATRRAIGARPSGQSIGGAGRVVVGRARRGGTPATLARRRRAHAAGAAASRRIGPGGAPGTTVPIVIGVALVLGGHRRRRGGRAAGRALVLEAPAARAARATATLEIRSQPPGAHVFVDGTPSGLRTPTVADRAAAGSRVSAAGQARLRAGHRAGDAGRRQARVISLTAAPAPAPHEGPREQP